MDDSINQMLERSDYKNVLKYFTELSQVPRGSGYNGKISNYLVDFAKKHGLSYVQDKFLNVIIYKPAAKGYENHAPVILQGHMDMVCIAEDSTEHDFQEEGLDLFCEGDAIGARGTTLGGDDGIALAYGMALLADGTAAHPALEVVFTTDEETGMYGAKGIDPSLLKGRRLINVDSEDEGVVLAGCAGGVRVKGILPLGEIKASGSHITINVAGLAGGHSGVEIQKYRVNAVYLLARLLFDLGREWDYLLTGMKGGSKDNAIPCDATACILVPEKEEEAVTAALGRLAGAYQRELCSREPGLEVLVSVCREENVPAFHPSSAEKLLFLLMQAPDGVQVMSSEIEGLVESSLNLGCFEASGKEAKFRFSVRSSIRSYKDFIRDKLVYLFEFLGGECSHDSEYPAWEYRRDSLLRDKFIQVFKSFYGKEPEIQAIHGGLECGLIGEKVPDMDMISIGPDMADIHTPKERLYVSSSIRVYQFLENLLAAL